MSTQLRVVYNVIKFQLDSSPKAQALPALLGHRDCGTGWKAVEEGSTILLEQQQEQKNRREKASVHFYTVSKSL